MKVLALAITAALVAGALFIADAAADAAASAPKADVQDGAGIQ